MPPYIPYANHRAASLLNRNAAPARTVIFQLCTWDLPLGSSTITGTRDPAWLYSEYHPYERVCVCVCLSGIQGFRKPYLMQGKMGIQRQGVEELSTGIKEHYYNG